MSICALTVSVDYWDFLRKTLPTMKTMMTKVLVVTTPTDERTIEVCEENDVEYFATFAFHLDGAKFNKGAAIEAGLNILRQQGHDWYLHIDADISLPGPIPTEALTLDTLWTARRYSILTRKEIPGIYREGHLVPSGYFQLWHGSNTANYPTCWPTAAKSDMEFSRKWPRHQRRYIPNYSVTHLETADSRKRANWLGRTTKRYG